MSVNRSQLMFIVLIVALVGNTIIHLTHPAYREYVSRSAKLERDVDDFRAEVLTRFAPIVSNLVMMINRPVSFSTPSTVFGDDSYLSTNLPPVIGKSVVDDAKLSYAEVGTNCYVVVNGILPLSVGQSLYGETIVFIDRTFVKTDSRIYLFSPSISPPSNSSKGDNAK